VEGEICKLQLATFRKETIQRSIFHVQKKETLNNQHSIFNIQNCKNKQFATVVAGLAPALVDEKS